MNLPVSLILLPFLSAWSRRAGAMEDLRCIFGSAMDSERAAQWLHKFQQGDFAELPPVVTLEAERMPGLWGGYSREKNRIYLSAECPPERVAEVLLEEVGHFLDRALCAEETPGEEGACFAALVLGIAPTAAQRAAWRSEEGWGVVYDERNESVLVEGAKKKKSGRKKTKADGGSSKKKTKSNRKKAGGGGTKKSSKIRLSLGAEAAGNGGGGSSSGGGSAPAPAQPPVVAPQPPTPPTSNTIQSYPGETLSSASANATFLVSSTDVYIAGNLSGTETIKTEVAGFSLRNFPKIENLSLTGGANISAEGNDLSNVLTGNSGKNTLSGLGGNDTLLGLAGDDLLDGGAGNDSMVGGAGNDTYVVDAAGDIVVENADEGIDLVRASVTHTLAANVEHLELTGSADINGTGNELNNSLTGNSGNNVLSGLGGNDTLLGGGGNDTLLGGGGEDLIDGGTGADSMVGGAGNDTYFVDHADDKVFENAGEGTDTVISSVDHTLAANVEHLVLTGAAVSGTGNVLSNSLTGNALGNSLDGGAGVDTLVGGLGNDTYFVDALGDVVIENAGEGTDLVISSVDHTLAANVEHLVLTGTAGHGTGNALANRITGNALGNSLDGGAGVDTLVGGLGSDTYFVDSASDLVVENAGEGTDVVVTSVSGYTLAQNVEQLILSDGVVSGAGNTQANTLTGNASGNSLDGGAGVDTMVGGAGNDTYFVDELADVVIEAVDGGTDTVVTSVEGYTLAENAEQLVLGRALFSARGTMRRTPCGATN